MVLASWPASRMALRARGVNGISGAKAEAVTGETSLSISVRIASQLRSNFRRTFAKDPGPL
jgi:hypothetical protein